MKKGLLSTTHKLALFGENVADSLSPLIHSVFAKQFGFDLSYDLFSIEAGELEVKINEFINSGGMGFNVTAPYKEKMLDIINAMSDRARHAQAINTVHIKRPDELFGDNTDGIGLASDLKSKGITISDKKICILGAGGVCRGILRPILSLSPQKVIIANRDKFRAENLIRYFKPWGKIRFCEYSKLNKHRFDVIINSTSIPALEILGSIPKSINLKDTILYDVNYYSNLKVITSEVKSYGISNFYSGIGMLIEQAAKSFKLWFNVEPDTKELQIELLLKLQ